MTNLNTLTYRIASLDFVELQQHATTEISDKIW